MIRGLLIASVIATFVGQAAWAAWMEWPLPHRLADAPNDNPLVLDPLLAWDRPDETLHAIITSAVWTPTLTRDQKPVSTEHHRI